MNNVYSKFILISCYWFIMYGVYVEVFVCIVVVIFGFCVRMICREVYLFYISFIDCNINIEIKEN